MKVKTKITSDCKKSAKKKKFFDNDSRGDKRLKMLQICSLRLSPFHRLEIQKGEIKESFSRFNISNPANKKEENFTSGGKVVEKFMDLMCRDKKRLLCPPQKNWARPGLKRNIFSIFSCVLKLKIPPDICDSRVVETETLLHIFFLPWISKLRCETIILISLFSAFVSLSVESRNLNSMSAHSAATFSLDRGLWKLHLRISLMFNSFVVHGMFSTLLTQG